MPVIAMGAAVLIALAVVNFAWKRMSLTVPRYKGPGTLSFLNDALEFITKPIELIEKASMQCGSVFSIQILTVYNVWLRGNDLNKTYLQTREDVWSFTGGMGMFLNKIIEAGYWEHYKTLLASLSKYINRSAAQQYTSKVSDEETLKAASNWESATDFELFDTVSSMVHKIIVRSLMGQDFYDQNADELFNLLHAMEEDIGSIFSFILPDWVPHPPAKRLQKARDRVKEIFLERLADRANADISEKRQLQDYIAFSMEDRSTAPLKDLMPSHHTLLMFAAHTSTAAGIAWNIVTLLRHPEILQQITTELRSGPEVDESILLQACIKETSRKYSGMKLLRLARENSQVQGTNMTVPKGAVVSISPYLTHHDPANFDNPEVWDPMRWIVKHEEGLSLNAKMDQAKYMPFGGGSHRCVGEKLANIMVSRSLITLLKNYDVQWANLDVPRVTDFKNLNFDKVGSPWLRGGVRVCINKITSR